MSYGSFFADVTFKDKVAQKKIELFCCIVENFTKQNVKRRLK